jgi:hypothetical protein
MYVDTNAFGSVGLAGPECVVRPIPHDGCDNKPLVQTIIKGRFGLQVAISEPIKLI